MNEPASELPFVEKLSPALDPWEATRKLAGLPWVAFLDSAARGGRFGRYSYVCASPFEVLVTRGRDTLTLRAESPELLESEYRTHAQGWGPPLEIARATHGARSAGRIEGLAPFQGGAIGLFGYGLSRTLEDVPAPAYDEFGLPDLVLGLYDWVLAFDHELGRSHIIAHGFPESLPRNRRALARRRVDDVKRWLADDSYPPPRPLSGKAVPESDLAPSEPVPELDGFASDFSRAGYLDAVERAVEYIRAGDVFQVNLSQRLLAPAVRSPLEHYAHLRHHNPGPFGGYFHIEDAVVASTSPEQFLVLDGRRVVTRPIKGTRPRGYTAVDDTFQGPALLESEKDQAENVMIVDLLRNDISRVARPGTVRVPRLFEIERHPTVWHLVSEVEAELEEGRGAFDLLEAAFPGGSITGAPKVRAMEIIAELEPTERGPYCGSLGWIAFHGGMETNILIRTVTIAGGWLQLPVGGGIVAMSRPEAEYLETLDKAAGMVRGVRAQ